MTSYDPKTNMHRTPGRSLNASYIRGLLRPMSSEPLDPFSLKTVSKASPARLAWTAQSRLIEWFANASYKRNIGLIRSLAPDVRYEDRGASLPNTSVTQRQQDLLLQAVGAANSVDGSIAEIGSFRGVTTLAMARATSKQVYAIDPFIGYGGSDEDFARFTSTIQNQTNVRHIRKTSGEAAREFSDSSIALVFIDGVHDFSNSWFDFCSWSRCIVTGGFVAFHDVDDHRGVTLTCSRVLHNRSFSLWGYCPNMAIFRKLS